MGDLLLENGETGADWLEAAWVMSGWPAHFQPKLAAWKQCRDHIVIMTYTDAPMSEQSRKFTAYPALG